jgi:hypothetical protein
MITKEKLHITAGVAALTCLLLAVVSSTRYEQVPSQHRYLTMVDESVHLEPLFPLETKDYWGFLLAILGLLIAAGGTIFRR